MPETLNNAAIAIVDEDQSPVSGRITTAFYPPYFVPPKLISSYEMDNRMDEGLDTFALNIPPDFQRDLLAGRAPTIQLNVDATRMSQAFTGGGYVQSIVAGEVSEFLNHYRGSCARAGRSEFAGALQSGIEQGMVRGDYKCDLFSHDAFDYPDRCGADPRA
ncbi:hypothetical protein VXQ18_16180 [Brucella abortus]|nr:hypothetical protein [Brucella abortus]